MNAYSKGMKLKQHVQSENTSSTLLFWKGFCLPYDTQ